MKIILSPAKKMIRDEEFLKPETEPCFLEQTQQLYQRLRSLSYEQLKKVWKCSDSLVQENMQRLTAMDLHHHLTPAVFAYEGIAYQYLAPTVFTYDQLEYIKTHLRILSGFYGLLRPMDGVTPYRLEMGARLSVNGSRDLYEFWNSQLAECLCTETDLIVNLASKEYSRAVAPYLAPHTRMITCRFVQQKDGKLVEQSTACKMARGDMARYMAEERIEDPAAICDYQRMQYHYSAEESTETTYVFIKEEQ